MGQQRVRQPGKPRAKPRVSVPSTPPARQTHAATDLPALARTSPQAQLLRWQQTIGNQAVQSLIARQPGAPAIQRKAPASAKTKAAQEATAVKTMDNIKAAYESMKSSKYAITRNTATLIDRGRVEFTPMTEHSENADLIKKANLDPQEKQYYFTGTTQDNQMLRGPTTLGTIIGKKIVIRGQDNSGTWQTKAELRSTLVHETSHVLHDDYQDGMQPPEKDSDPVFKQYQDEFRAYWVQPTGYYAGLKGDAKVAAIREQLVGTSATSGGYTAIRKKYWTDTKFKQRVDTVKGPPGYNLSNSPALDDFYALIERMPSAKNKPTLDEVLEFIRTKLTAAERKEAAGNPTIAYRVKMRENERQQILEALGHGKEAVAKFPVDLNPNKSPRIDTFLQEVANFDLIGLRAAYLGLTAKEKSELQYNFKVMLFLDWQVTRDIERASIYAMLVTRDVKQYPIMRDFLEACLTYGTKHSSLDMFGENESDRTALNDAYRQIKAKLDGLHYEARLALYKLDEPTRKQFVDTLPAALRAKVLYALREGGTIAADPPARAAPK